MRSYLAILGVGITLVGFGGKASGPELATSSAAAAPAMAVPSPAPVPPADTARPPAGADELAAHALAELAAHVKRKSHDDALRLAFKAYYNFKAAHPDEVKKPYLYYVDYGLDNRTARGYVFDMEQLELVEGPFVVAHGRGSSNGMNAVPTNFSNRHGSAATSLGLYVTQETYNFSGKSAGRRYTSIGLRMSGESGRFNSNARGRGVVVHGAPYVTASGSGRSEGCPAMEQSRARRLIPMIANGAVVFQFSPNDRDWMENDPWLH